MKKIIARLVTFVCTNEEDERRIEETFKLIKSIEGAEVEEVKKEKK